MDLESTTGILELPTGDVVQLDPANGTLTIGDLELNKCKLNMNEFFVLRLSCNGYEGKVTSTVCQT